MKPFIVHVMNWTICWAVLLSQAMGAPPVNSGPKAETVNEDTPLHISQPPLSVIDPDGNLSKVELNVSEGTLKIKQQGHATETGNGTKNVIITGNQQDINNTLNTLEYQGDLNASGRKALLHMTSYDSAGETASHDIDISIIEVNSSSQTCNYETWKKSPQERYPGDLQTLKYFSVGPAVSYSLIQYNLADKKTSFNARAVGAGLSLRYYSPDDLAFLGQNELGRPPKPATNPNPAIRYAEDTTIADIPAECRAQTTDLKTAGKAVAWLSLSPTMYVFQEGGAEKLGVQFAINLGILNDIFNVGVGWNLSGQNAGEWFILAGPSFGFKF